MIPVTIRLDSASFDRLERIAQSKGVTMRELIAGHIRAGLDPEPHRRVLTRGGRPLKSSDVEAWVAAARMGVTNAAIADRWGVSKSLVSRTLIDRGVRRQRARAT